MLDSQCSFCEKSTCDLENINPAFDLNEDKIKIPQISFK
jgi:hypothetical protein